MRQYTNFQSIVTTKIDQSFDTLRLLLMDRLLSFPILHNYINSKTYQDMSSVNFEEINKYLLFKTNKILRQIYTISNTYNDYMKVILNNLVTNDNAIKCVNILEQASSTVYGSTSGWPVAVIEWPISLDIDIAGTIARNYLTILTSLGDDIGALSLGNDDCDFTFTNKGNTYNLEFTDVSRVCRIALTISLLRSLCDSTRKDECRKIQVNSEQNKKNTAIFLSFPLIGTSELLDSIENDILKALNIPPVNRQDACNFLGYDNFSQNYLKCFESSSINKLINDVSLYFYGRLVLLQDITAFLIVLSGGMSHYKSDCDHSTYAASLRKIEEVPFKGGEMLVCDKFFLTEDTQWPGTKANGKFFTIIHELTHMTIGTIDGINKDTYGPQKCCIEYALYRINIASDKATEIRLSADCMAALIFYKSISSYDNYNYNTMCEQTVSLSTHNFNTQSEVYMYTQQGELSCSINILDQSHPDEFLYTLQNPHKFDLITEVDLTGHYNLPGYMIELRGQYKTYRCTTVFDNSVQKYIIAAESINQQYMSLREHCGFYYELSPPGCYKLKVTAIYAAYKSLDSFVDVPTQLIGEVSCEDQFLIVGAARNEECYMYHNEYI